MGCIKIFSDICEEKTIYLPQLFLRKFLEDMLQRDRSSKPRKNCHQLFPATNLMPIEVPNLGCGTRRNFIQINSSQSNLQ